MEPVLLPKPVAEAIAIWTDAHERTAPGTIEGLYLVGSAALGDWTPHSDIDIIAVVADPSDPDLVDQLAAAQVLVSERASIAIDGPYVAWGDLVVPPMAVHRPWVLDGRYHVDAECFEINPVTWYTLATYGIALRGDRPDRLDVHVDLEDRRRWVVTNLDTYWRGVGRSLEEGLGATSEEEWGGELLEWVALGVARMLLTYETGDVVSKSAAGRWAAERIPGHEALFHRAVEIRATTGGFVTRDILVECAEVTREIVAAVTGR